MLNRRRAFGRGSGVTTTVAALLVSLSLAGCYTVLRHPADPDSGAGKPSGSCLRCHSADEDFGADAVPWVEYYSYSSYPWINYYGSPWWYDSYWSWDDECRDCGDDTGGAAARGRLTGRQAWGRRPRGGWADDAPERTSSALDPIAAPPPTPPSPPPATSAEGTGEQEENAADPPAEKKEPRGRVIRR